MKYNATFSKVLFVGMVVLVPVIALADLSAPTILLSNPTPGAGTTLQEFVNLLIEIVQWVVLPLLALAIIYAGFLLVSAGGNDEQITKGKNLLLWTLVGATIVLGARVIANVVFGTAKLF